EQKLQLTADFGLADEFAEAVGAERAFDRELGLVDRFGRLSALEVVVSHVRHRPSQARALRVPDGAALAPKRGRRRLLPPRSLLRPRSPPSPTSPVRQEPP